MELISIQQKLIQWMIVLFVITYLPRIIAWFKPFKKQHKLENKTKNKLALIIPARNEGTAVIPLFESIQRQTYDRDKYDIYVVVKDRNDPVREYAKMINATVYTDVSQTCKGDCLDYTIKSILRTQKGIYDGYIIVDADCALEPTFFEEMNNAMVSGAQVINAKKIVKNYYSANHDDCNLVTCCNGIIWTLIDELGNRFKSDHGYTTMTISTGILITKDLIEKWNGWPFLKTLTEDMELQRDCSLNNYKTFYYSHAIIYMEEAPSHEETNKRRNRWMTGLIDADKIYYPELSKKKDWYNLKNNYYIYCLWIPYVFIGGMYALVITNIGLSIMALLFKKLIAIKLLLLAVLALGIIYTSFFIMTLFAIVIDWKYIRISPLKKLVLLFIHPLFYMEYIKIVSRAIRSKSPQVWEEIERVEVKA